MIPIIRWSLWERRWSILGWTLGLAAYIVLTISVYDSIRKDTAEIGKALANLPASVQALFGSNDFISPIGYLTSKIYYPMLPLLLTIFAISLSGHLLAREEQDGTLELLLARPVSRTRLLVGKLLAGFIALCIATGVTLIVIIICVKTTDLGVPITRIVEASGVALLLSMLFGAVAWAMTGLGKFGRRASVGIATLVTVASYLIASLEGFASWLKYPAKIMPFHYYHPGDILHGTVNWAEVTGLLLVTLLLMMLAWLGFRRRDLD